MSVEEEVELRDLVAQTLELNGCLPKIRAQLRANLFLALDEDSKISKQQPFLNTKVKSYLEVPEGKLMFCLVREFLEYFDLDITASVYEPESYIGSYYKYEGRQKIVEDLGIKEDDSSGPVLLHLVKIAQTKTKTLKINLNLNGEGQKDSNSSSVSSADQVNGCSVSDKESSVKSSKKEIKENGDAHLNSTYVKKDTENDDTFNGTSSIEEDEAETNKKSITNEDEEEAVSSGSSPETKSNDKTKSSKSEKLKSKLELSQINKSRGSDILPSLYHKDFKEKQNKDYDFEIKDDYEEDFLSGSEIDFSRSKNESPKPLFEELQQCSDYTTNFNHSKTSTKLQNSNSDNKISKGSSTDDIETNLSVDEDATTETHNT